MGVEGIEDGLCQLMRFRQATKLEQGEGMGAASQLRALSQQAWQMKWKKWNVGINQWFFRDNPVVWDEAGCH